MYLLKRFFSKWETWRLRFRNLNGCEIKSGWRQLTWLVVWPTGRQVVESTEWRKSTIINLFSVDKQRIAWIDLLRSGTRSDGPLCEGHVALGHWRNEWCTRRGKGSKGTTRRAGNKHTYVYSWFRSKFYLRGERERFQFGFIKTLITIFQLAGQQFARSWWVR